MKLHQSSFLFGDGGLEEELEEELSGRRTLFSCLFMNWPIKLFFFIYFTHFIHFILYQPKISKSFGSVINIDNFKYFMANSQIEAMGFRATDPFHIETRKLGSTKALMSRSSG